jgi:hypothetical protein
MIRAISILSFGSVTCVALLSPVALFTSQQGVKPFLEQARSLGESRELWGC